jgi:hypothetical protein
VDQLRAIDKFAPDETVGQSHIRWDTVLRWWLDPRDASIKPNEKQVSSWHDFIAQGFVYRFNWGLGSIIALATDDIFEGQLRLPSLTDWPQIGLPWAVFWLKELIVWGTLEPVAAYLLAHGVSVTRTDAEQLAESYYEDQREIENADDLLDASRIREWAEQFLIRKHTSSDARLEQVIKVDLLEDFSGVHRKLWRVMPVEINGTIRWTDPAGFPLASCVLPENWQDEYFADYDFLLNPQTRTVTSSQYLAFRDIAS